MGIRSNRNVVFDCSYHVVWCPKYRRKVLEGEIADRLRDVISHVCSEKNAIIQEMEIMPDHVHLLVHVDPQYGVGQLIKSMKGRSARVLRKEFPKLKSRLPCLWTSSYFVSSVGGAPLETVKTYIENQKAT